jgi:hypothetical protein
MHQHLLLNQVTVALDEVDEEIERLRREWNRLPVPHT